MVAKGYFKSQFLMGFKKDHQGTVISVQDFVVPVFKMRDDMVEE